MVCSCDCIYTSMPQEVTLNPYKRQCTLKGESFHIKIYDKATAPGMKIKQYDSTTHQLLPGMTTVHKDSELCQEEGSFCPIHSGKSKSDKLWNLN